jgi:hypothetical protein
VSAPASVRKTPILPPGPPRSFKLFYPFWAGGASLTMGVLEVKELVLGVPDRPGSAAPSDFEPKRLRAAGGSPPPIVNFAAPRRDTRCAPTVADAAAIFR